MIVSNDGASSLSARTHAALYADAVDRAAVPMALVSADGVIQVANLGFARMVGSTSASLAGVQLSDVLSAGSLADAWDTMAVGHAEHARPAFRPLGEARVEVMPSHLDDGGMLVRLHDADYFARHHSGEAHARSLAAGDIVHLIQQEARTPLTSIRGYAELMTGLIRDPEEMAELARVIHDEAVRLSTQLDDLAMLERITGHSVDLQIGDIDVNSVVRDATRRVEAMASGVEFRLDLNATVPAIRADRDALLHMVTGLIRHAQSATPEGAHVLIETGRVRRRLFISVTDFGSPVAPADLEPVFDVFRWIGPRTFHARSATSLALPIAREISRLHGWQVSAESRDNNGLTVRVTVPIAGVTPALAAD